MSFSIRVPAIGISEKLGDRAALRKTTTGWEFATEEAFEDFIWANLDKMFGLTPFARQFYVQGQYCDILAIDKTKRLTVIELKVTEDRYIIQQLTRYYDALKQEQPHPDRIDYQHSIQLIAIQPSFHKDNLIDIKYHILSFKLFQFKIVQDNKKFSLSLTDYNTHKKQDYHIPYREIDYKNCNSDIPPIPETLANWLGSHNQKQVKNILKIREQILQFDSRMEETVETAESREQIIKYGKGKSKPCGEFRFAKSEKMIIIFLYLHIPNRKTSAKARMQISTQNDYAAVNHLYHVPKGLAKTIKDVSHSWYLLKDGKYAAYAIDIIMKEALEIWRDRF